MAKKKSESKRKDKARPGFVRVPGKARRYKEIATGKVLSRRQYIKRTENVPSLEAKAKRLKEVRKERGDRQPMNRYNAIVRQYKETHGAGAKVRGKSGEDFQRTYREFITTKSHSRSAAERKRHYEAGQKLGIIRSTREWDDTRGSS